MEKVAFRTRTNSVNDGFVITYFNLECIIHHSAPKKREGGKSKDL